MLKPRLDLDLDLTMPNVKIVQAIFIYYIMFKRIEPLFFELSCTQAHTQLDRHPKTQTD